MSVGCNSDDKAMVKIFFVVIYIIMHIIKDMHGNLAINRPGELWHTSFDSLWFPHE